MIRSAYASFGVGPPAPFVHVTIRNPGSPSGDELTDQPSQIDTGADRTVIPLAVVKHLGLVSTSTLKVGGLGGVETSLDTYLVSIEVHGVTAILVEVVAAEEPWILLGRDVVNQFRLLLDGPSSALEIG